MTETTTKKPFPGFDDIYLLDDPLRRHFRGEVILPVRELDDWRWVRGESTPPWYVAIRWAMGKRYPSDFIFTTCRIIAIHERAVQLLQEHGFTGWKTYPVYVVGKDPTDPTDVYPDYHGLVITGRCGPLDWRQSTSYPKQYPGGIFMHYRGAQFDPNTWDGSDLFVSGDTLIILITGEVKRAFERAKVQGVNYTRLTEYEEDGDALVSSNTYILPEELEEKRRELRLELEREAR